MSKGKKEICLGCIKLDLMAMCEDNEVLKEEIRAYFERDEIGGY